MYPWTTTINNSPRYKDIDSYNINYVEEAGLSITDSRGYFMGVSDQDADRPQFTTVDKKWNSNHQYGVLEWREFIIGF